MIFTECIYLLRRCQKNIFTMWMQGLFTSGEFGWKLPKNLKWVIVLKKQKEWWIQLHIALKIKKRWNPTPVVVSSSLCCPTGWEQRVSRPACEAGPFIHQGSLTRHQDNSTNKWRVSLSRLKPFRCHAATVPSPPLVRSVSWTVFNPLFALVNCCLKCYSVCISDYRWTNSFSHWTLPSHLSPW